MGSAGDPTFLQAFYVVRCQQRRGWWKRARHSFLPRISDLLRGLLWWRFYKMPRFTIGELVELNGLLAKLHGGDTQSRRF